MVLHGSTPAGSVPAVDSLMVPLSLDPDCVRLRTNVPEKVPPYVPVHLPERPLSDVVVWVVVVVTVLVGVDAATSVELAGGDDDPPPPLPPQAAAVRANDPR